MMVLNRKGLVFIGRRTDGPEHVDATHVWQMPQGGIDEDEDSYAAALRELYEETSIRSVQKLGEIADWLTYDLPGGVAKKAWGGKYRGQKQKWYALRFTGKDSEINIDDPGGGHKPATAFDEPAQVFGAFQHQMAYRVKRIRYPGPRRQECRRGWMLRVDWGRRDGRSARAG